MKGFLQDFGEALKEGGYTFFPMVPRSKRPAVRWKSQPDDLKNWLRFHPETGIAVNARTTPAVDVDVRDREVSRKMAEKLASMFPDHGLKFRIGEAPKFLVPFQTDEPFRKISSKKYADVYGIEHQIEILCDGQYFVAYGVHPKTERNFVWKGQLHETPRAELPKLTAEQAAEVVAYFEEIKPDDWAEVEKESSTAPSNKDNPLLNVKPKTDLTPEEVAKVVESLDPDLSYKKWFRVGMGLYHQFDGDDEGFNIWNDWSQRGEKYDASVMDEHWVSFQADYRRTNPVTFASVIAMSKEEGIEETKPPLVGFKSLADLANNIGSIKWLIKGWLEASTMSCVFGDPGSYKSFVAIDQACSIATGTPWQGCEVDQGTVIYIAGEGHGGLGRRVAAWCKANKKAPEEVPVYFSTAAADMHGKEAAVELSNTVDQLLEDLGRPRLAMVVYDTLARNMGAGDENSTSDMNTFINHIDKYVKDKYGTSVMLVHHTGHKDKHRARGSSAFLGALDHNLRCQKNGRLKLTLSCTKMKDAEEPEDMYLKGDPIVIGKDSEGNFMDSLAFHRTTAPVQKMKELTTKQKDVLEVAKGLQDAPGSSVVRVELYRALEEREIYKEGRRVRPLLESLAEAGYIDLNENTLKINLEVVE